MTSQPTLFPVTPNTPRPLIKPAKITSSLKEKAILVDFDGGCWEWTRRDRRVETDVTTRNNVSKAAVKAHKNLFLSCDTNLEAIRTVIQKARASHVGMTLPWAPSRNLLLNKNALTYQQTMLRFQIDLDNAKATLSNEWQTMLSRAASALGPLHDPRDYPALGDVLSSAYITHKFYPLADDTDVRLVADSDLVADIKAQVKAEQATTYSKAVLSSWERLLDVISSAVTNLSKTGQKGERFRSEWHDNLASLLPLLSGLNLDDDPRLDDMAKRAQSLLRPDPEEYGASLEARAKAFTQAQAIYSDLSAIYGTLPGSEKR